MSENKFLAILTGLVIAGAVIGSSIVATIVDRNQEKEVGFRMFSTIMEVIDGDTATTTSSTLPNAMLVKSFANVDCAIETTGSATATIQFTGSLMDDAPDPSATSSITNQWSYIEVVDLEDGTAYDGDTGIAITGTDIHKIVELNISTLAWVRPMITSYTTGTIYVSCIASDN